MSKHHLQQPARANGPVFSGVAQEGFNLVKMLTENRTADPAAQAPPITESHGGCLVNGPKVANLMNSTVNRLRH